MQILSNFMNSLCAMTLVEIICDGCFNINMPTCEAHKYSNLSSAFSSAKKEALRQVANHMSITTYGVG